MDCQGILCWHWFLNFDFLISFSSIQKDNCSGGGILVSCSLGWTQLLLPVVSLDGILGILCIDMSTANTFLSSYLYSFYFLFLMHLLGLPVWCWVGVVREDILDWFLILGGKRSVFSSSTMLQVLGFFPIDFSCQV